MYVLYMWYTYILVFMYTNIVGVAHNVGLSFCSSLWGVN